MNIQRPVILNEAELDWETWDDPELAAKSPVRWKILIAEQYLLDLEHEVFLSLCGEQETHARIEATLPRSRK